jgi:hypothetical protein
MTVLLGLIALWDLLGGSRPFEITVYCVLTVVSSLLSQAALSYVQTQEKRTDPEGTVRCYSVECLALLPTQRDHHFLGPLRRRA